MKSLQWSISYSLDLGLSEPPPGTMITFPLTSRCLTIANALFACRRKGNTIHVSEVLETTRLGCEYSEFLTA